jgi:Zn-dependent protease with chaperone function
MSNHVFSAEFVDGQSAVVRNVTVHTGPFGLSINEGDIPIDRWVLANLVVNTLGQGVAQVENRERPGALLTFADTAIIQFLQNRRIRATHTNLSDRRLRRLGIYLMVAIGVAGLFYWGVTPLSRVLAHRIPMDVERRLGLPLEEILSKQTCTTPASAAAFTTMLKRLGESPASGVEVRILNLKLENAFTFPGGSIMITRGLLNKATDPDEVAGVIAHELAHVHERHIMIQVLRGSILSLGWAVTVGDFSGLLMMDPQTLFQVVNQGFSRDSERQADEVALERLHRGRISAKGFAEFFKRFVVKGDVLPEWLSSHPDTEERLKKIESAIGQEVVPTTPVLGDEDWQALRSACGDRPVEETLHLY